MDSKRTPGPWRAEGHRGTLGHKSWYVAKAEGYWGQIARVMSLTRGEADAHLIAAAPDLLAACEMMLAAYAGKQGHVGSRVDTVEIARAAVAKAKGER